MNDSNTPEVPYNFPSPFFLHSLYNGIKFFVFAPLIFIVTISFAAATDNLNDILRYLLPLLMLGSSGYILYATCNYKDEVDERVSRFVSRVRAASIIWSLASLLFFFLMVDTNSFDADLLKVCNLAIIVGYLIIGSGYGIMYTEGNMRGSQLAARGCYAVAICAILLWLILELMMSKSHSMMNPKSIHKTIAMYQLILFISMFVMMGGMCAVVFGTRFMVDSAEINLEVLEEDEESALPAKPEAAPVVKIIEVKTVIESKPADNDEQTAIYPGPQDTGKEDDDATKIADE